jgi:hypothetical protein
MRKNYLVGPQAQFSNPLKLEVFSQYYFIPQRVVRLVYLATPLLLFNISVEFEKLVGHTIT